MRISLPPCCTRRWPGLGFEQCGAMPACATQGTARAPAPSPPEVWVLLQPGAKRLDAGLGAAGIEGAVLPVLGLALRQGTAGQERRGGTCSMAGCGTCGEGFSCTCCRHPACAVQAAICSAPARRPTLYWKYSSAISYAPSCPSIGVRVSMPSMRCTCSHSTGSAAPGGRARRAAWPVKARRLASHPASLAVHQHDSTARFVTVAALRP